MTDVFLPGAVIGVLGGGQLGRMFTIAARQLGYRVHVLAPDDDTPAGQVADREVQADYSDFDAVSAFAREVDIVTFEFENVPMEAAKAAAQHVPVRPGGAVLHTTQHRLREKNFLARCGFPLTQFAPIRNISEVDDAVHATGLPAVLKTACWGYDGRGQQLVKSREDVISAWKDLGSGEAVLERWVNFTAEISVVAARSHRGEIACYPPIRNVHRNHILDISSSPASIAPSQEAVAIEITSAVLESLDVVGVLCVEFFVNQDGELLINELAPRPHNSGHLTVDAHVTSQFEQQVRAVCGLPLGSTEQLMPAAMVNLLGDLWTDASPNWMAACEFPDVKLHLYGKSHPRVGRKMGHLTALADLVDQAVDLAVESRRRLTCGTSEVSSLTV